MFLVLAAVTVVAFAATLHVAADQEDRLLHEQAVEVQAVLAGSVAALESSLKVLGPVGARRSAGAGAVPSYRREPARDDTTTAFGVAAVRRAGRPWSWRSATAPRGPAADRRAPGPVQAALARTTASWSRASSRRTSQRRLLLAMRVQGSRAVVYRGTALDRPGRCARPRTPLPWPAGRALRLADDKSFEPDRHDRGRTADRFAPAAEGPVGADRWLLVVAERHPWRAPSPPSSPGSSWPAGSVTAWLVAAIVETLLRRRAWAMSLVRERTGDLELALDELSEAHAFVDRLMTALAGARGPVLPRPRPADLRVPQRGADARLQRRRGARPGLPRRAHRPRGPARGTARFDRVAAESVSHAVEFRFHGPGEVPLWLSTVIVPDVDEQGRLIGMFAYAWDVSARRHAEQAQREAQAAAEAANRAKSEFLSRMSHEPAYAPLNSVLGFGQLRSTT